MSWPCSLSCTVPPGGRISFFTTFAVGILFHQAVLSTWGPAPARVDGLAGVLQVGPLLLTVQRLFVLVVGIATLILLERLLKKTRFGVELRAVAQSEQAARVVGIDVTAVNRKTFILASAIAALSGGLLAPITSYSPMLGDVLLIKGFVIVVIGGLGSSVGAVVCALLVALFESMFSFFMPEGVATAVVFSLMVGVLLVRPQGLAGGRT